MGGGVSARLLAAAILVGGLTLGCQATPDDRSSVGDTDTSRATPQVQAGPLLGPGNRRGVGLSPDQEPRRPNVIVITTDDQTLVDMRWMPLTRRALGDHGVTFRNGISPHPLCCPARAEILTGEYAQNNGVRSNKSGSPLAPGPPMGGFAALRDKDRTIARWLHDAGYRTAFVGKFLNGYRQDDGRQRGWEHWEPFVSRVFTAFHYTVYKDEDTLTRPELHSNDFVGSRSVAFIRDWDETADAEPFFMWSSFVSPHARSGMRAPVPAFRHRGLFSTTRPPTFDKPSFNEPAIGDKPWFVAAHRRLQPARPQRLFRSRLRCLASVDEAVRNIVIALRQTGELDNTYIIFTSDNGFLFGEHRRMGKTVPYEEALRVPFLIRGPGIPAGERRDQTVTTVDIAGTVADIAGVTPLLEQDGVSFLPIARSGPESIDQTRLIQAGPYTPWAAADWGYRGVRTDRYTYVRYSENGFEELYDRRRDPYELHNVAASPTYARVRGDLGRRLDALVQCHGHDRSASSCVRGFGPLPEPVGRVRAPTVVGRVVRHR